MRPRSISAPVTAGTAACRSGARNSSSTAARTAAMAAKAATSLREAVDGLNTLIDYRYQQHFTAKNGRGGMGKDRHGANGADVVLKVPVGTQIYDEDGETLLADLTRGRRAPGARARRQWRFRQCAFQELRQIAAPRHANPGQLGNELHDPAAAEADCRRRRHRPAERRQIDVPRGRQRGKAEDRRLSVHDAAPAARCRRCRWPRIRRRRSSRTDRGRARRNRPRRSLSRPCRAMPRAAASCRWNRRRRRCCLQDSAFRALGLRP